jgi:hypothetical protein
MNDGWSLLVANRNKCGTERRSGGVGVAIRSDGCTEQHFSLERAINLKQGVLVFMRIVRQLLQFAKHVFDASNIPNAESLLHRQNNS